VKNGQADAMMYDDSFLVGVAATDSSLKLTSNIFLKVPWGIGIRKNEPDMKRWVDAAVRGMRARDMFWAILKRTIPRRFWTTFKRDAPSPTNKLQYPRTDPPENNCPR
jgi:ABC-type amino acid transport substrate-binding protein